MQLFVSIRELDNRIGYIAPPTEEFAAIALSAEGILNNYNL